MAAPAASSSPRAEGAVDLSVLIVSHGHERWLPRCIGSVAAALAGISSEILVLDNLGGDLTPAIPPVNIPLRVLANRQPLGFAANVNYLVEQCRGRDVIVLNPDTEFARGNIGEACAYLRQHVEVGMLGCRLLYEDGSVQPSHRPFPSLPYFLLRGMRVESWFPAYSRRMSMVGIDLDGATAVDWVFGAFLLFRREEFLQIGGMDQKFPLYYEDVDLAIRFRRIGKLTIYYPDLQFYHVHLRTSAQRPFGRQWRYHVFSAARFFWKHRYILTPSVPPLAQEA